MNFLLAVVVGTLFASGIYLVMRRSLVKLIIGLGLLGHAANLLIFTVGRASQPTNDGPPIIPETAYELTGDFADPLPQALVLTAIVIGFGVLAFVLVLVRETARTSETGDISALQSSELPNQ